MSKDDTIAAKVKTLLANPESQLQKFQTLMTESKGQKTAAENEKFQKDFAEHLGKFHPKLAKAIKILEAVATGQDFDNGKLPDLILSLESLEATHRENTAHAVKTGLVAKPSGSKRKRA